MKRSYKVSFGYITGDRAIFGTECGKMMSYDDLVFMFKVIDPFMWSTWMMSVRSLKMGGYVIITLTTLEDTKGHGYVNKVIRIDK